MYSTYDILVLLLHGVLTTAADNQVVKVTAIDSRTKSSSENTSCKYSVYAYASPTITTFTVVRNSTTNTTLDVSYGATITSLNSKNTKQTTITTSVSSGNKVNNTTDYNPSGTVQITGASASSSYTVTMTVKDSFTTVTQTINIGTAFKLMHFKADGTAMSIAKMYDTSANGRLQIGGDTIVDGTVKSNISNTNPTTGTWYYPTFVGGGTGQVPRYNDGLRYHIVRGTASATGASYLQLGNGTASGTAGNQRGVLRMYGDTAYYHQFQNSPTANRTITLPNAGGTMALLTTVYPVGAIYMSTSSTSPASLFGGTWEQIKDRFLWCTTTSTTTGGSQTKNIQHNHGAGGLHALGGSINDRADTYGYSPCGSDGDYPSGYGAGGGMPDFGWVNHATNVGGATDNGGSTSLNIMPPWYSVYCWRRTA